MGKFLLSLVLIVSAVVIVVGGCAQPAPTGTTTPAQGETIVLRFAHNQPPMHQQHKDVIVPWAAELEKRTGGRVKVNVYPAQSLGKANEYYDMVLNSTVDMALIVPSWTGGRFPLEDIFNLPFFIPGDTGDPTGTLIRHTVYEKYIIPTHFSDVKPLWTGRFSANAIHMANKPVRKMEDIKGLIIGFASGTIMPQLIKAVGASPETIPVTEMYIALEKKTIDGQVIPLEAMVPFKLNEVTKYDTLAGIEASSFIHIMNQKTWDSLPPDIQKIIDDLNPWIEEIQAEAWAKSNENAISVAKESGIELIEFSPEEKARWVEAAKPIDEAWIEEMDARGLPASQMYNEVKEMLAK